MPAPGAKAGAVAARPANRRARSPPREQNRDTGLHLNVIIYNRVTGLHLAVIYNALLTLCTDSVPALTTLVLAEVVAVSALVPLPLVLTEVAAPAFCAPVFTSLVLAVLRRWC